MRNFIMLLAAISLAGVAEAACPATQQPTIIAAGGRLSICSSEATTAVRLRVNGVVKPDLPIALVPGTVVDLAGYTQCAKGTLEVAGVNAAGVSPYGAPVDATFPGCVAPIIGPAIP